MTQVNPEFLPDSLPPSSLVGRGLGGGVHSLSQRAWHTSPELWEKLKPLARQMRCKPTPAEKQLWQKLKNKQLLGLKFRRQHSIDRFIVDFYCNEVRLVVEVDGSIHDYTQEKADPYCCLKTLSARLYHFFRQTPRHLVGQEIIG
jgi:very-short-patch-repair endonuclease